MLRTRVFPCLLLQGRGLVKTTKFKDPVYLGDPINVVRIFNEKEIDELALLDITATEQGRSPDFDLLAAIAGECFVPMAYGGGVRDLETARRVLALGFEKVVVNAAAVERPEFVQEAARCFGSQSVVVSIDVRRTLLGRYEVMTHRGRRRTGRDPVTFAREMEEAGAGEIVLTSIDRDGTMQGYDLDLVRRVTTAVGVPVVACGGAGDVEDLVDVVSRAGAAAAAAGSMFVFQGPHRGILITFPVQGVLEEAFPDRRYAERAV